MHQSERNPSPRKDLKPPPFKHKFPSFTCPIVEHMINKPSSNSSSTMKRMDGKPPVGIGTKGTVGSLVLQEIEYFRQLEINSRDNSRKKPDPQLPDAGSTISLSKRNQPNLGSTTTMPKKKKKGSSRIIPSMCSMVDVVEKKNQPNLRSRFSYRSLEADVKTVQF